MKNLIISIITLVVCMQAHAQEGHYAEVNGVKIYYEVYGQGEPLVFLHGFTMSHEIWDEWIEDLSNDHQLILVDLRGHGHSTNPTNHFSHRESAKDIYGLMDAIRLDTFKGMGFSSGGMTLTHMAAIDSSRIKSMILIGSTSYYPESTRAILQSINYEALDENWMNDMLKWHPGGEPQIKALLTQFKNFGNTYEDMNFTPPYLSSIKTPTLIIHGDRDPFFPVDLPVTSYKSMPNSYLWIVPNFGHSSITKNTAWDNAFINIVNQFLLEEWYD